MTSNAFELTPSCLSFLLAGQKHTRPPSPSCRCGNLRMEGLEEDIKEVDSLLSVAVRPLVRGRLALLLSDLQQVLCLQTIC